MSDQDQPEAPPLAQDVGYKRPPKAKQWRKGQSGNAAGKPKAVDLKGLVQKANAKKVPVKTSDGTIKKVPQGLVILKMNFVQAIGGDVAMQKQLMKDAKKYLPPPEPAAGQFIYHDVKQSHIDALKAYGCLPAGCSDILEEISLADLNKAQRAWNKLFSTPAGIEKRKQIEDELYGPMPTEEEIYLANYGHPMPPKDP